MSRLRSLSILFCFVFGLAALPVRAQVERASIIGNITDKTGAAMAGVEVTVTNESTNTAIKIVTRRRGRVYRGQPDTRQLQGQRVAPRFPAGGVPELRAAGGAERAARHHRWRSAVSSRPWK